MGRLAMKVVILAGGVGSRLSEETDVRPKPMVEIGYRPILWHIMKHYSHYGFNDFVLCLGYKGDYIKRYFTEMLQASNDITVDFSTGVIKNTRQRQNPGGSPWSTRASTRKLRVVCLRCVIISTMNRSC